MKKTTASFCFVVFIAAIINFVAYAVIAGVLGGDAFNGEIKNGSYYLASHGKDVEVSRLVWLYSYWHTIIVFITHPAGMIGLFFYIRSKSRESIQ